MNGATGGVLPSVHRSTLDFPGVDEPVNSPDKLPQVSVVIVCYEMAAQVENTLRSLLPPYQRDVTLGDYEIILMDNGSSRPLDERLRRLSPNLRYVYIPPGEASPNPAVALNRGAAFAQASLLCLMIDGARMLTPGVLAWGLRLMAMQPRAMVEVRGWHLGPKFQPESIMEGYDERVEKELLEKVRWWENGYRLFDISALSAQTRFGLSRPASESNCLFLSRTFFNELGGMDERYASAGGGLVNHGFFARAVTEAETVFTLLGEGNFHQTHGGAATGLAVPELSTALRKWRAESEELGQTIEPDYKFIVAGHMPPECTNWLSRNAAGAAEASAKQNR